jgi:beta-glucosidase
VAAITERKFLGFPEGFLWGAATSHFQIEGHPEELSHRLSDWSQWTATAGKIADASTADLACQFFERFGQDMEICRDLHLNAFRISLNWPILCPVAPEPGQPLVLDPKGVIYYRELLASLKADGVTTFVTLFHFTLPHWLSAKGGWNNPESASDFANFAEQAVTAFGDLVDFWLTLNEPLAYVYQGYVSGLWPPGYKHDYLGAFTSIRYMLEGHALAYKAIHNLRPGAKVSFAMHWRPFVPKTRWNPFDCMVTYFRNYVFNRMFPQAVQLGKLSFPYPISKNGAVKALSGPILGLKGTQDYIAVNYYTRELSCFKFKWPIDLFGVASDKPEFEVNCLGWENFPDGFYQTLVNGLKPFKYNLDGSVRPIYVTENGFPTAFNADMEEGDWSLADDLRVHYLETHLHALHRAIKDGANVKGYLYWSLLDNFEWAEGLKARFGLVRITYPTQERTLRKSAHVYADIAKKNGILSGSMVENEI